jgi:hypothetical protein
MNHLYEKKVAEGNGYNKQGAVKKQDCLISAMTGIRALKKYKTMFQCQQIDILV